MVTIVISAAVVYVLAHPANLPIIKDKKSNS